MEKNRTHCGAEYAYCSLFDNLTPRCLLDTSSLIYVSESLHAGNDDYWIASIIPSQPYNEWITRFAPIGVRVKIFDNFTYIVGESDIEGTFTHGYHVDILPENGINVMLLKNQKEPMCAKVAIAPSYPLVVPIMHPCYLDTLPYLPFRMLDIRDISSFTITFCGKYVWLSLDTQMISHLHKMGIWMIPLVFMPKRTEFTYNYTDASHCNNALVQKYSVWQPDQLEKENAHTLWNLKHVCPPTTNCECRILLSEAELKASTNYMYPVMITNIRSPEYLSHKWIYKQVIYTQAML